MKNSAANRSNALSSCAGLFINSHLGFDFPGTVCLSLYLSIYLSSYPPLTLSFLDQLWRAVHQLISGSTSQVHFVSLSSASAIFFFFIKRPFNPSLYISVFCLSLAQVRFLLALTSLFFFFFSYSFSVTVFARLFSKRIFDILKMY